MAEWFSCNGACGGSDPTSDTVKVDVALLAAGGKENVQPKQAPEKAHEVQKAWEEQRKKETELKAAEEHRQSEEEAKRQRAKEDANLRREEQMAAQHEAAERERMARHQRERMQRQATEDARAKEEEELQAALEESERTALEATQKEEQRQAAAKDVAAWCKQNGFVDMKTPKKSFMGGSKFALHKAVSNKEVDMVKLMVLAGVDKAAKNSKGQTAADLATSLNKPLGSMDEILKNLD